MIDEVGELRVQLERRRVTAGDELQGQVHLSITHRVQCSNLVVFIEGREHISWEDKAGSSRASSAPRRRHNRDVLREQISLNETLTVYHPGAYEFPFSYRLPKSLPNSFRIQDRDLIEMGAIESYIAYKVRAAMRLDRALKPQIEGTQAFVVQQPPLEKSVKPVEKSSSEKVRVFRVLSRGICTLSASLDNDVVSAGEMLTVFTSVNNQSSKDMTMMSVKLVEDLAVDVPFRTQKRGSTVICRRDFPGVRAGRQADRALSLNLVTETPWRSEPINPTMTCHFIKWKYRLIVSCRFRLCGTVKVEFPVLVSCQSRTGRMSIARISGPFSSPVGVEDIPLGPRSMPRIRSGRSSQVERGSRAIPQSTI